MARIVAVVLLWIQVQFGALRVLERVTSPWGEIALVVVWVASAIGAWLFLRGRLPLPWKLLRTAWPSAALVVLVAVVAVAIYPAVDDRRSTGGGSDADDAVVLVVDRIQDGLDPFGADTYLGNPPTTGPGSILWAAPFPGRRTYTVAVVVAIGVALLVLRRRHDGWEVPSVVAFDPGVVGAVLGRRRPGHRPPRDGRMARRRRGLDRAAARRRRRRGRAGDVARRVPAPARAPGIGALASRPSRRDRSSPSPAPRWRSCCTPSCCRGPRAAGTPTTRCSSSQRSPTRTSPPGDGRCSSSASPSRAASSPSKPPDRSHATTSSCSPASAARWRRSPSPAPSVPTTPPAGARPATCCPTLVLASVTAARAVVGSKTSWPSPTPPPSRRDGPRSGRSSTTRSSTPGCAPGARAA